VPPELVKGKLQRFRLRQTVVLEPSYVVHAISTHVGKWHTTSLNATPRLRASAEETGLSGGLSQFHLQPESEMWKLTHFPILRSSPLAEPL
jgi:hypothetical protein